MWLQLCSWTVPSDSQLRPSLLETLKPFHRQRFIMWPLTKEHCIVCSTCYNFTGGITIPKGSHCLDMVN
ncbi:hypothetical protein DPMN_165922 [Dreissena polymorpha]|uniref:Uncharacterized protein n=1 Tax=Dreissena polymorpha TaxID=45954 RepID=A0A9D4EXS9_DREPO|nr:hypothetical protein DPMN_165922 [Dreissena polymorpha]